MKKIFIPLILIIVYLIIISDKPNAKVTGLCVNCHTMHNSQNGQPMVFEDDRLSRIYQLYGPQYSPLYLLRADCVGCHVDFQGNQNIKEFGGSKFPQVYLNTDSDCSNCLAGGNFKYADPADDEVAASKGHNVVDITGIDYRFIWYTYPGFEVMELYHGQGMGGGFDAERFTCAGPSGCHGKRTGWQGQPVGGEVTSGIRSLYGSHHRNVNGQLDNPTEVYNSYRFLYGVKGYENNATGSEWRNTISQHNEYFGLSTPPNYATGGCQMCHANSDPGGDGSLIKPYQGTISSFCSTCHGGYHTITDTSYEPDGIGIGTGTTPFKRHPTDLLIPNVGEYQVSKRQYNPTVPYGRTTVPNAPITGATSGDVVTCLSCHYSHAGPYPSMLRFDYSNIVSAGGSSTAGCFTCHTEKDTP